MANMSLMWVVLMAFISSTRSRDSSQDAMLFPGLGISLSTGNNQWFNTSFDVNDFYAVTSAGPWLYNDSNISATITSRAAGGYFDLSLAITSPLNMPRISFPYLPYGTPMDSEPGLVALLPMLGGIFVKAGEQCYADGVDDNVMEYPGGFHAPYVMLATQSKALMAAATTWPPHHLHPKRRLPKGPASDPQPLQIDWVNGYEAGSVVNISIMLTSFATDRITGVTAWQASILAYRQWLKSQIPAAIQPPAMVHSEGMMAIQLENSPAFNLTSLAQNFNEWKDILSRVQIWGQMSNYAGPPKLAKPPLLPGEIVSCCALNQSLHPRYLVGCNSSQESSNQCLPAWARSIAESGYEVGYYTRKGNGPLTSNLTWLETWLSDMAASGGNAQYVDTYARVYNGQPSEVLSLIDQGVPPANAIVEGWNDLYPFAGLLSGYHRGFDWCNCTGNTTIYDMDPFNGRSSGSFIKLVRLLMGDAIGYFGYEDGEHMGWGAANKHFSERQAFIMGLKIDAGYPLNGFLRQIKKIRDNLKWWFRSFTYLDTVGVVNNYAGTIDIRRHDDVDNKTVLLIDNWQNITGLSVEFEGKVYSVSSSTISAIEIA